MTTLKGIKYITVGIFAELILLLARPGVSSAQSLSLEEITRQAIESGIEQSLLEELKQRAQINATHQKTVITITQSATEMDKNNLPYEMIFNKSFEGLTKGVPSGVMENAILNIRKNTEKAAVIVDPWLQKQNDLTNNPAATSSFRNDLDA